MLSLSLLLIATTLVGHSSADIPVNCSHSSIVGIWTFHVGEGGHDNSINCDQFQPVDEVRVQLVSPDVAKLLGDPQPGFWTMIYNQGFEVVVGGRKYFAFSNYTGLTKTSGISHCGSTLNGWVHDISGENWACYYGVKNPSDSPAASISEFTGYTDDMSGLDLDSKYVKNMDYVAMINSVAETWTATHYPELEGMTLHDRLRMAGGLVSSDHHPTPAVHTGRNHNSRDDRFMNALDRLLKFSGRTPLESRRRTKRNILGYNNDQVLSQGSQRKDYFPLHNEISDSFAGSLSNWVDYISDWEAEVDYSEVADLPESIDWRDIDGVSYVPPVRNQGACGSCFAISTMSMLYSRIKILTKGSIEKIFSPQDVLSCSQYSQGCHGGFSYLVGKYAEDFGLVEEDCFPYTASMESCSNEHKNCPRYYAKDYKYIGKGYYGGCSEHAMMVELVKNGPFTTGYKVYNDFYSYKSGIYKQTMIKDKLNHWKESGVGHSVLVVGYGVENGVKYWIAQNSWGTHFGEDGGYFRIARGTNEATFESRATAATPVLPTMLS